MEERRTIKVKQSTYDGIMKLGEFQETFDDVIQRIIGMGKDREKKQNKLAKKIASKI
jgi:predicted CopG family antitoxin